MVPHLIEAVLLCEQGVPKEDIDRAARLGLNYLIGPLGLIDLLGIDIFLHSCNNLLKRTGDQKFTPPKTIIEMVENNKLGCKTKHGFYEY